MGHLNGVMYTLYIQTYLIMFDFLTSCILVVCDNYITTGLNVAPINNYVATNLQRGHIWSCHVLYTFQLPIKYMTLVINCQLWFPLI
jgi:hypothetical protein